jgi:hypothetical protein
MDISFENDGIVYTGPADSAVPTRLINAIARGEVTEGGLAEAGWFVLGTLADDD